MSLFIEFSVELYKSDVSQKVNLKVNSSSFTNIFTEPHLYLFDIMQYSADLDLSILQLANRGIIDEIQIFEHDTLVDPNIMIYNLNKLENVFLQELQKVSEHKDYFWQNFFSDIFLIGQLVGILKFAQSNHYLIKFRMTIF